MPRKRNHNKMALIRILCLWYVIDTFGGDSISIVLTKPSIIIIDITRSNITKSHTQYKSYRHKISPTLRSPKTTQISPSLRNTFCKNWLQEIGCARRWRNVPLLKRSYWPPRYHINAAVVTAGSKRIKVFWSCLKFQQHVMKYSWLPIIIFTEMVPLLCFTNQPMEQYSDKKSKPANDNLQLAHYAQIPRVTRGHSNSITTRVLPQ